MKLKLPLVILLAFAFLTPSAASALDPALKTKVDAQITIIKTWAADPAIVAAVKAQNASLPADLAAMTQDRWTGLSVLDPVVRGLSKNAAAGVLKAKKTAVVAEAFLSAADGKKVAFLSKSSNWSHKGKPKHDQPMAGKVWIGEVEVDESTGIQSVQVSVPVLDGGKAIGSLIVGLSTSKL